MKQIWMGREQYPTWMQQTLMAQGQKNQRVQRREPIQMVLGKARSMKGLGTAH